MGIGTIAANRRRTPPAPPPEPGPELLPNTSFSDGVNVTLQNGATVSGGALDLGTTQYGFGREGFTLSTINGDVFVLDLLLASLGNCSLRAQFGNTSNASAYGDLPVTGSGQYSFTCNATVSDNPLIVTIYNNAAGSVAPRVDTASFKRQ